VSAKLNWNRANADAKMRRRGAETASSAPRAARKTDRRMPARKGPTLDEPIIVAKWWKNRSSQAVYVRLSTYEGQNLVDVRTWFTDAQGISQPGKGFACSVKHLPQLVDAFTKALAKALELGLLDEAAS